MPNLSTTIILALLFVTIGFIGGAMVAVLYFERQPRSHEREKEAPPQRHEQELRLWRERPGAPLTLEVDGQVLQGAEAVDSLQRETVTGMLRELAGWVTATKPAPVAAPPPPPAPVPVAPASPPPAVTGVRSAPGTAAEKPAAKKPKKGETAPAEPKSIVEQIDEIFQDKLAHSPLAGRPIWLGEDPRNGGAVHVDQEVYYGIDAVPDGVVLSFIRESVQEWERRTEQGAA
ncbi:MAG: hypothetical protein VB089_06125 [Anaerolineaceae bacterium]|nr:hypothetical protein [Anaerolineaceae bacterium]